MFCSSDCCIRAISTVVGSTVQYDRALCAGGAIGAGYVDIDESCDRNVGVFVSLSQTEIVFEIACLR